MFPRDVYEKYWSEMDELLKLPGKARRPNVSARFVIPADVPELASPQGVMSGTDPAKIAGVVIDDRGAIKSGKWTTGSGLEGYVGRNYLYTDDADAKIKFQSKVSDAGRYDIRLAYQPHENRGNRVPVSVTAGDVKASVRVDMTRKPPLKHGFISLGEFDLAANDPVIVVVSTDDAGGLVHVDAVQILRVNQ